MAPRVAPAQPQTRLALGSVRKQESRSSRAASFVLPADPTLPWPGTPAGRFPMSRVQGRYFENRRLPEQAAPLRLQVLGKPANDGPPMGRPARGTRCIGSAPARKLRPSIVRICTRKVPFAWDWAPPQSLAWLGSECTQQPGPTFRLAPTRYPFGGVSV